MKTTLSILITHVILFVSLSFNAFADTFNHDKQSSILADASLEAMGGRENYNTTRYISWVFFGKRFHIWDKFTGDIRIEYDNTVLLMNIHTKQGRAWENGQEITNEVALKKEIKKGYASWVNDSYWVVMPYKLHDDGVTLSYTREDKSLDGKDVDVATMTFNDVGLTPQNKYEVYFDQQSHLVTEFAFFPTVKTTDPKFRMSWANWQPYGNILLSDKRNKRSVGPINTFNSLPKATLQSNTPARDNTGTLINGAKIK